MAFIINQNFDLKAGVKDFERQNLVVKPVDAENSLKNAPESWFPDDYTVTIGGIIYIFNSKNSADATLGKWRKLDLSLQQTGGINPNGGSAAEAGKYVSGVTVTGRTINVTKEALTKAAVGLGNVDNTADADKPISTATQTAINAVKTAAQTAQDTADNAATNAHTAITAAESAQQAAEGASQAAAEAKAAADANTAEINTLKGTVSSAYRSKGSKATFAEVQAITDAKVGDVWNVEAAFTLDGKKYPAGTNVVWADATMVGDNAVPAHWDPLGGVFDTSALENSIGENTANIGLLQADLTSLQTEVDGLTVTLSVKEI